MESIKSVPNSTQTGRRRISFSFTIAVGLFLICLIYIPQWKHYAPTVHASGAVSPYLTPWTVISVMTLSFALGLLCAPFRDQHPALIILSKTLSIIVACFSVVFLLEYATGIRFPDLDIFFLPASTGERVVLYAARPTPNSAITSISFATALLLFRYDSVWRRRLFQLAVLVALLLPTLAGVHYLSELFFAHHATTQKVGLSFPAVMLYYLLGSGVLALGSGLKMRKSADARLHRRFVRPI
ncbi:MAG TPA: hypothetical protein VE860_17585 [Chthoniobacterales bacterium]|nr:hypothetical protein [Chthoniobacterales bacterium]